MVSNLIIDLPTHPQVWVIFLLQLEKHLNAVSLWIYTTGHFVGLLIFHVWSDFYD